MDDRLLVLDHELGQVAVLSLTARGLLPDPSRAGTSSAAMRSRVLGVLLGAAAGSAMGAPFEWRRPSPSPSEAVQRLLAGAAVTADVQLLGRSLRAILEHGISAAPRIAEQLPSIRLRRPGRAIVEASNRSKDGVPWFETGPASYGNGALVRAAAVGLAYAEDPHMRPLAAALDTVVTHAHPDAVAASIALGEIVAALAARPDGDDPSEVLRSVAERLPATCADPIMAGLAAATPPPSGATAQAALAAAIAHARDASWRAEVAVPATVAAGGDTDTVAAVTGLLCGAVTGADGVPATWVASIRNQHVLQALADRVVASHATRQMSTDVGTPESESPNSSDGGLHIAFLLDRSGSMQTIAQDVVGGFNAFLATHRAVAGACCLTLAQFDSHQPFEVLRDALAVGDVRELSAAEYQPRGLTPLYDAIGSLLDVAEARIATRRRDRLAEEDQLVVIFTDGLENASVRNDRASLFARVGRLQDEGWAFLFLGAGQDSYAEAARVGVRPGNTSNWREDPAGARLAMASVSRASAGWRSRSSSERHRDRFDVFEGRKEAEVPGGGR